MLVLLIKWTQLLTSSDFTGYALALDMTARDLQSAAKVCTNTCTFLWCYSSCCLLLVRAICHFLVALETQKIEKAFKLELQQKSCTLLS